MFSPSLQSLIAQAQIEELHRVAQTQERAGAFAAAGHEVDCAKATHLSAAKCAISRMLGVRRGASAAIHGLELVTDSSAATPGPRP